MSKQNESKEKEQTLRYSNDELQLLKDTFADNDYFLKVIRKVFLQKSLTEREEMLVINSFRDKNRKNLANVIRKFFLPEIDGDVPLNQITDLWYALDFSNKTSDEAMPYILAREALIKYLRQQLDVLEGGEEKLKFADLIVTEDAVQSYVNLMVRNSIIQHVEQQLMNIKFFANLKDETPEEAIQRLKKDSSK